MLNAKSVKARSQDKRVAQVKNAFFQTFDRTCVNVVEVSNDLLLLFFQISSKIWKAL